MLTASGGLLVPCELYYMKISTTCLMRRNKLTLQLSFYHNLVSRVHEISPALTQLLLFLVYMPTAPFYVNDFLSSVPAKLLLTLLDFIPVPSEGMLYRSGLV